MINGSPSANKAVRALYNHPRVVAQCTDVNLSIAFTFFASCGSRTKQDMFRTITILTLFFFHKLTGKWQSYFGLPIEKFGWNAGK
ncbi:hypothetical protein [Candidatus Nitrososphaera evergladensis]|uniref:hypothetical protein n=1 Tax=Candidatus Nitrososphaera evergladensis TaxID=1459637 RepID=UPI0011E5942E|nr:hypothetical protein [Candidatus Nitrososphaera evergladensis]